MDYIKLKKDDKIKELNNRIHFLENEFDSIENTIFELNNYAKISPKINFNKNTGEYNVSFHLFNKKWNKIVNDEKDIVFDFTNEDLIYIASKFEKIDLFSLSLITKSEDMNTITNLYNLMDRFYIRTLIKKGDE